jgi:hypothetical protein
MAVKLDEAFEGGWLPKIYGDITHTLLRMILPGFVGLSVFSDKLLNTSDRSEWLIVGAGLIFGLLLYVFHEASIRYNTKTHVKFSLYNLFYFLFLPGAQKHFQVQRNMLISLFHGSPANDNLVKLPLYVQNEFWKVWQHLDDSDTIINALKKAFTHNAHFLGSIRWFCLYSSSGIIISLICRFFLFGSSDFLNNFWVFILFLVACLLLKIFAGMVTKSMEEVDNIEARTCMKQEDYEKLFGRA